jgi:hypothetical protein
MLDIIASCIKYIKTYSKSLNWDSISKNTVQNEPIVY